MKTNVFAMCPCAALAACAVLLMASRAPAQNLFEADDGTGIIYEYTPAGVRTALASPLLMEEVHDLAFDSSGNLFASVEVSGAYFIDEFTTSGTTVFASGLEFPTGLAFNSAGDLFVADTTAGNIYEYTPAGRSTFATGLSRPSQLAFNSAGDLFVTDRTGDEITEITPGGVKSTFATGVTNPYGLAFNSAGDLFVGSQGADDIYEYTPGGVRSTFATGVDGPYGLAFNSTGNLFVVAAGAGDIYEYAPDGTRSTFFAGQPELDVENIGLAFQGVSLPVPEPGAVAFAGLGGAVLLWRRK